jgi:hypothetical protein
MYQIPIVHKLNAAREPNWKKRKRMRRADGMRKYAPRVTPNEIVVADPKDTFTTVERVIMRRGDLHALREEMGFTAKDVVIRSGGALSSPTVYNVENGTTARPLISTVVAIADAYGVSLDHMVILLSNRMKKRWI